MSALWDEVFATRPWGRWPDGDVIRTVARLRRAGLDVLEIGSGPGAQLWYLEHEGHHAFGLDSSTTAVELARARLTAEGHSARVVRGDLLALPYAAASFDVVIDVEAISSLHESHSADAWIETARVLKPAGVFVTVAFTLNTYAVDTGTQLGARTVTDVPTGPLAELGTWSFLDDDTARRLAAGAGLQPVDSQRRTRTVGPDHELVEELIFVAEKATAG